MPVVFLKRAAKTASAEAESVGDTVKKILDEIEAGVRRLRAPMRHASISTRGRCCSARKRSRRLRRR